MRGFDPAAVARRLAPLQERFRRHCLPVDQKHLDSIIEALQAPGATREMAANFARPIYGTATYNEFYIENHEGRNLMRMAALLLDPNVAYREL